MSYSILHRRNSSGPTYLGVRSLIFQLDPDIRQIHQWRRRGHSNCSLERCNLNISTNVNTVTETALYISMCLGSDECTVRRATAQQTDERTEEKLSSARQKTNIKSEV